MYIYLSIYTIIYMYIYLTQYNTFAGSLEAAAQAHQQLCAQSRLARRVSLNGSGPHRLWERGFHSLRGEKTMLLYIYPNTRLFDFHIFQVFVYVHMRVEFRSMEVALTDFENAAFTVFVVRKLCYYIYIPKYTIIWISYISSICIFAYACGVSLDGGGPKDFEYAAFTVFVVRKPCYYIYTQIHDYLIFIYFKYLYIYICVWSFARWRWPWRNSKTQLSQSSWYGIHISVYVSICIYICIYIYINICIIFLIFFAPWKWPWRTLRTRRLQSSW